MELDEKNPLHAEKIAKYLSNEMSENELQVFGDEFADSQENINKIEKMKKEWIAIKSYHSEDKPDTLKAWNKLNSRLDEEGLIPDQTKIIRTKFLPKMLKAAAAILVLVGIGSTVYFSMNRPVKPIMVQLNTSNEANTLIKTLNDGSVIYIAQNSLFSFPQQFEDKSRNVELKGEAFFDIASNPEKPFIIETADALIEVLGTAFNVKAQNGTNFELSVDRGKVKVSLKNNPSKSMLVIAGEKITANKNNLEKSKNTGNRLSDWYKQKMHFKDETLHNIINVLNRNFNTTFVEAENEIGCRKLTVTFQNETAETMTELICVTLNLKSQNINGSVVLSESKENTKPN